MQLILVNLFVFLGIIIIRAFTPGGAASEFYQTFISWIALPSPVLSMLKKPWTLFTHMFVHQGVWHLGFNMLWFYWFGRIVGDLIGDRKILPLYFMGGLFGAFTYLLFATLFGWSGIAFGASAAVMSFVVAAGFLAPEYEMRLLLFGNVKLKYIALAAVLLDLVMLSDGNNTGGRIAHLGGAVFGGLYIYLLREGRDLLAPFTNIMERPQPKYQPPSHMEVVHSVRRKPKTKSSTTPPARDIQAQVDAILDKINKSGYDSLSKEDKEILYQASKNQN